jgi:hypothetical protein
MLHESDPMTQSAATNKYQDNNKEVEEGELNSQL